jgi:hypothetical protein
MIEENKNTNQDTDRRIDKYQDVYGVSTRSLNFGLWFIEHKTKIKAGISMALILFSLASWGYSLYSLIAYLNNGKAEDELMISEITRPILATHNQLKSLTAIPLSTLEFNYFKNANDKTDFYARISNPNSNYIARVSYCYYSNSMAVKCGNNFIFPSEEKYLLDLNVDIKSSIQNLTFNIESTGWSLVNKHEIPNWDDFKNQRNDFSISNIEVGAADNNQTSSGFTNLSFLIKNNSPYNYRRVPLDLLFYRGGNLISVSRIVLENILFDEERLVSLVLPDGQSYASQVDIIPDLDIMDENNYLKSSGEPGFVK